jgi:hypothetical protein
MPGGKATCCASCKTEEMIDVKNNMCRNCNEMQIGKSMYGSLCVGCYIKEYPSSAIANAPKYHKTEFMLWALLSHHFQDYSIVKREYQLLGLKRWRIDFVLENGEVVASIECDGETHFRDWASLGTKVLEVVRNDIQKMEQDWKVNGVRPQIRAHQPSSWNGYPVDYEQPITFDSISAIAHLMPLYQDQRVVIFVEPAGCSDYDAMKEQLRLKDIPFVSFQPSKEMVTISDARQEIFWTQAKKARTI